MKKVVGRYCSLASGSRGNSLYFESGQTKLLIDAGLSARAIEKRLSLLSPPVSIREIDAILITHEHIDHIRALRVFSCKYGIPLLCTGETARAIWNFLQQKPNCKIFFTGESFCFRDLTICPFPIPHDAIDPVCFTLSVEGVKFGLCTDFGFATSLIESCLSGCSHLYLEANHDPELVECSPRSSLYKRRVLSRWGHLSNQACAQLLERLYHERLEQVTLAHLSQECNRPELALATISDHLEQRGLSLSLSLSLQESSSPMQLLTASD